jgi:hypothetical protein
MTDDPVFGREPFDRLDAERSDPHTPPLDNDDDAQYLDPIDPRRRAIEAKRGKPFDEPERHRGLFHRFRDRDR